MPDAEAERFAGALTELAGPAAQHLLEIMALLDDQHPATPHEYLWFLGVVPAAQGHGIGSDLMGPVLDRADQAGEPAHTDHDDRIGLSVAEMVVGGDILSRLRTVTTRYDRDVSGGNHPVA